MLILKPFDTDNKDILEKEWVYIRDLPKDENGFTNDYCGISWEYFCSVYVPHRRNFAEGRDLPKGFVRQIDFILWDEDTIAGMFRVRPQLNDFLRNVTGGHIGYGILPKFRGKGYATEGLSLALRELQRMTDDSEAYLFCGIGIIHWGNNYEAAISYFDKTLELAPENDLARQYREVGRKCLEKKWDEAKRLFDKDLRLRGKENRKNFVREIIE